MPISDTIDRLADSWCARNRPESMNTDWGQSLLAYGLMRAVEKTGNEAAREYLRRWLTYHLGAGVHVTYFVGSWSIGLLYPGLMKLFPEFEHALRDLADRIYMMIREKAIRNGHGIILHNVDLPHVYIDTIYYTLPVLAKLGPILDAGDEWKRDAMHQLRGHLVILNDIETGFSIHCQENLSELRSQGAWGRGNGWVAMTCAELLTVLEPESEERAEVEMILRDLVTLLLPLQTSGGLWRTILTDESSYEETSATAMFLFAMLRGRAEGVFGNEVDEPIKRALHGLTASIDSEGRLLGCSEGTWPGTIDYYKGLATGEWWWGTGAALLALAEIEN
jgi:unsaturated rhamnogalacturonyl hydrolase